MPYRPLLLAFTLLVPWVARAEDADGTGMASCDEFLRAYAQCATAQGVPEAARPGIRQGIAAMRGSFRDSAAANPRARSVLAKQCVDTHAQVRQRMVDAFRCDFPGPTMTAAEAAAQADAAPPLPAAATPSPATRPDRRAAPVRSAAEQEAAKANAYTEVQNDIVSSHPMQRELAEHIRNNERVLKLGTKLGANAWYLFGISDFDGTIKRLDAAIALPGTVAEADETAKRLLASLQALNPVVKGLERYQTTREFKEDGFKYAREQEPVLVARMRDAIKASTLFGDTLFNRRMASDETRMTGMPQDSFARRLLGTSLSARRLVRRYDATDAPADLPEFQAAVAALVGSNRELASALDGLQPAAESACKDYSGGIDTLVGRARDYAGDVRGRSDVRQSSAAFAAAYNRAVKDLQRCRELDTRADAG